MSATQLPVIDPPRPPQIDLRSLHKALTEAISTQDVRSDRLTRALYATDASVYQIVPLLVAFPAKADDVVAALKVCARFRVPITARGGGTSQAGQSIGPGVILDGSKHFDRVLEINPDERWVRVEPGCVLDELNRALKPHRLLFAPDISTSNRATIGGMIANNSSGARSVLYGKTIDHVLALKVVLSDGSIVDLGPLSEAEVEDHCARETLEGACYRVTRRLATNHAEEINHRFPKILRRVGGYNLDAFVPRGIDGSQCGEDPSAFNLARLFVGSEGTLGVTVEAKLRLVELPRARGTLVVEFAGLLEALAATPLILQHHPAAVEVVDKYVLDSTLLNPEATRLRTFLEGDPAAILVIELYGESTDELGPRLANLEHDLRKNGFGYHHLAVMEPAAQARIWKLRTMALGLSMAEKGDAKAISFVEDTAVAPEHLRDYIAEFLDIIARHQTRAGVYAHASVGCLHVRPVINLKTEEGVRRFESIAEEVSNLVLKYGGALSGEHGDGLVRSPFQEKMYGSALYNAFRELKRTFDPHNLLNPGKIVDAPPLSTNLRYGPAYITPAVTTTFDFTADGGLLPAAELCAGVGACRKKLEGTMCPSFQATREEKDSTARSRQPAPHGNHRPARIPGVHRPARPRRPRPLPRMQGLQGRVSHQCQHGPAQGRVPAPVLSGARRALAQSGVRPCGRPGADRQLRWHRSRAGSCKAACRDGSTTSCSGSTLAACRQPSRAGRSCSGSASSRPLRVIRDFPFSSSPTRSPTISSPRLVKRRSRCSSELAARSRSVRRGYDVAAGH